MRAVGLAWLVVVVAGPGCRETTPTQLVVFIDTDLPEGAFDAVSVLVEGPDGRALDREIELPLPASFGIRPKRGDAERRVTTQATARREGSPLVTTTSVTSFVAGHRMRLDLFLSHECIGVLCAPDETCRRGDCVDPWVPPGDLTEWDRPPDPADAAVLQDAGRDAGREGGRDAGIDAGRDAGIDAGRDAGIDASADAGPSPCVECNPLTDLGCLPDETCRFYEATCNRCEAPGNVPRGDLCDSEDDCGAAHGCLLVDGAGTCREYCQDGNECSEGACLPMPDTNEVGLCSGECDPVDSDCPGGTQCLVDIDTTIDGVAAVTYPCVGEGGGAQGASCEGLGCAPGTQCLSFTGGAGTCRPYCRARGDCIDGACATLHDAEDLPLGIGLCTGECDPIGQDCPQGQVCTVVAVVEPPDLGTVLALACQPPGSGDLGVACPVDGCVLGAGCVLDGGQGMGLCREICLLGNQCGGGGTYCVLFEGETGFGDYGYCP